MVLVKGLTQLGICPTLIMCWHCGHSRGSGSYTCWGFSPPLSIAFGHAGFSAFRRVTWICSRDCPQQSWSFRLLDVEDSTKIYQAMMDSFSAFSSGKPIIILWTYLEKPGCIGCICNRDIDVRKVWHFSKIGELACRAHIACEARIFFDTIQHHFTSFKNFID